MQFPEVEHGPLGGSRGSRWSRIARGYGSLYDTCYDQRTAASASCLALLFLWTAGMTMDDLSEGQVEFAPDVDCLDVFVSYAYGADSTKGAESPSAKHRLWLDALRLWRSELVWF